MTDSNILYEDNHLLIVNKQPSEIVQPDKTGDQALLDKLKEYLKHKYNKPGNVFLGLCHRLDRPTSGAVIFAKTSKALSRMSIMFKHREVTKKYWAIVEGHIKPESDTLTGYMKKNRKQNKSYVWDEPADDRKKAILHYKVLQYLDHYSFLEVTLETGRHHQIRAQLSNIGHPVKGDLKYNAKRSNPNPLLYLHARYISFIHPVTKEPIQITAPTPDDKLWKLVENND